MQRDENRIGAAMMNKVQIHDDSPSLTAFIGDWRFLQKAQIKSYTQYPAVVLFLGSSWNPD